MGYNNNHAGMHMIWYHRRNSYDDLEYYDRLAETQQKQKELLAKRYWRQLQWKICRLSV